MHPLSLEAIRITSQAALAHLRGEKNPPHLPLQITLWLSVAYSVHRAAVTLIDTSARYAESKSVELSLHAADSALLSLGVLRASRRARVGCYTTSPTRK